ncbi:MAG: AAA family ATPase [Bacillota bacterium]|nr:AAA family ATPase [Bacillota bacterium]
MATLRDIEDYLRSRLFEREDAIRGCLLALLAREHVLVLGPPGTGKSDMVRELERTLGLRRFEWLLTKFSVPEEIVGPVSVKAMQEDRYCRVTIGKLPEAEIAFIDECFKASSAILNTMLAIMNERVFHNDGQPVKVPLQCLFGASNEVPQGDDESALQAFMARFLLRYQVNYLVEQANFLAMLDLQEPTQWPTMTQAELAAAQQAVAQVVVPQEVKEAIFALRKELADQGIVISDRQWHRSVKVLRASAFLDGRAQVDVARDFDVYCHICWTDPSQQRTVVKTVRRVADPLAERVLELLEEAQELYDGVMAKRGGDEKAVTAAAVEANSKLRRILKELAAVASRGGPVAQAKAREAHARVDNLNRTLAHELLGIEL